MLALRFDNWKVVFMEQRGPGTLRIWAEPFVALRVPKLFNLRTDPFERADITSNTYYDWLLDNDYIILAAHRLITEFLETFEEFPPRQKAASFTIDQVVEKLEAALTEGQLTARATSEAPDDRHRRVPHLPQRWCAPPVTGWGASLPEGRTAATVFTVATHRPWCTEART